MKNEAYSPCLTGENGLLCEPFSPVKQKFTQYTGWLLDVYGDTELTVWLLDEQGPRRLLRQPFPVTFYAHGEAERLRALWRFLQRQGPVTLERSERYDVFSRSKVPVLKVTVPQPVMVAPLFRQVSRQFPDLNYGDADLALSLRFAAVTGVSPLCRCRVVADEMDRITHIEPLESPWELDPARIPLRVLSLEPEVDPAHRDPRFLWVRWEKEACRLALNSPRALLVTLKAILQRYDPDILLTRWGDTWLLPRLLEMQEACGLALPLNRDRDSELARRKERWYFSYGQVIYRGEQVLLFGRSHLDCKNAMLWSDYELDGVIEMARVTALPLQTAARVSPGTGISSIQMLTALRQGILVPWQKQQAEFWKPAADLFAADQGGLVYQPIPGVHYNVAEVDFVSMYPAIMVNFDISPETLGARANDGPTGEQVPGLNLTIDRSQFGIVPQALAPLLEKRVALKKRLGLLPKWHPSRKVDQQRASALKWLLVTCFGYLGYKNARFGRIEAHQAVTAYGRECLLQAKEAAEDSGFDVLHLYVDGMWLRQEGKSDPAEFGPLLEEIQRRTGLPIVLDGIYRWVVFLSSRVYTQRAVANRYFGVFQNGEIKARGIAARRRDTPVIVAEAQMELLNLLAAADHPADALPQARRCLDGYLIKLRRREVPLDKLLVSQRLSRDIESYRTPSPSARAAMQLKQAGKHVRPGQSVRFIFTRGEPGVYAWDLPTPPNPATMDVERYITLLLRAAQEVLEPFGAMDDSVRRLPLPQTAGMWATIEPPPGPEVWSFRICGGLCCAQTPTDTKKAACKGKKIKHQSVIPSSFLMKG